MQAWDEFLRSLDQELGAKTVDRWLRTFKVLRFDSQNLYLETNEPLQIAWFEEHIRPRLVSFVNNNQKPIRVHLAVPEIKLPPEKEKTPAFILNPDRLDPEFTFENFVVSAENAMAHKLLSELNQPLFNPIYLFGPKGCGKTHLLTAAAIELQKKKRKVFYVRAETFTSHVVQAIRLGAMQQFRAVYRDIDTLIVDGIDIFSRKDATQEEFFHTFNALHTMGKQLLLSAVLPPSQLTDIEPRLISRFEWGISLSVGKADPKAILEKKASLWKLSYSPELIAYLATRFPSNPLLAIQALSLRAKGMSSLTSEKVEFLLKDLLESEAEKALTPEKIIKSIASHYGIKPEDLLGKSQMRECALPRQVAMYLCRERLQLPFQKIGEIFSRDHSTVITSVRGVKKALEEKSADLSEAIASIEL